MRTVKVRILPPQPIFFSEMQGNRSFGYSNQYGRGTSSTTISVSNQSEASVSEGTNGYGAESRSALRTRVRIGERLVVKRMAIRGRSYVSQGSENLQPDYSIGRNSRAGRLGYSGSGTQTREFRRFLGLWAKCSPKASFFTLELDGASLKEASQRPSTNRIQRNMHEGQTICG